MAYVRKLAEIPQGNPLDSVLALDLLDRCYKRKRHGDHVVSVDYFCGAGGFSSGVVWAREQLKVPGYHYGINHDPNAIETISSNHNGTFINSSVEVMPIRDIVQEGYVTIFTGSAECIMHSPARAKDLPIYDQSRTSAAYMLQAIHDLPPEAFILENVSEWTGWGPLDENYRPLSEHRGEYFEAFMGALRDMGYSVEWKVLNSADYGSATSRRRLFVLGVADRGAVLWPVQTHAKDPAKLKGINVKPWRAAKEVIDWNDLGESLFRQKKGPHAAKSLRRMRTGFTKQQTALAEAYAHAIDLFIPIAEIFHGTRAPKFDFTKQDLKTNKQVLPYLSRQPKKKDETVSPLTAEERKFVSNAWRTLYDLPHQPMELSKAERTMILHRARAEAEAATIRLFKMPVAVLNAEDVAIVDNFTIANRVHASARLAESEPIQAPTTATGCGIALVATNSMVLGQQTESLARDMHKLPLQTILKGGAISAAHGVVEAQPMLVKMNASDSSVFDDATRPVDKTMGTLVTKTCLGLASPSAEPLGVVEGFAVEINHGAFAGEDGARTRPLTTTFGTITAKRGTGICSPFLSRQNGFYAEDKEHYSSETIEGPMSGPAAHNHHALVSPFIARQNGFYGEDAPERATTSTEKPLFMIPAGGKHHALVMPGEPEVLGNVSTTPTDAFILEQDSYGGEDGTREVTDPIPTLRTIARVGLVNGYIVSRHGGEEYDRTSDPSVEPLPCPTGSGAGYVVNPQAQAFISVNYGEREGQTPRSYPVDQPLNTIVPKKGAGVLIQALSRKAVDAQPWIVVRYADREEAWGIDVLFRMLKNLELARAMGFGDSYKFAGVASEVTKQIGNAVDVTQALSLAHVQLRPVIERVFGKRRRMKAIAA